MTGVRQAIAFKLCLVALASAQSELYDFLLVPKGVTLGMDAEELATIREPLFPGPSAQSPNQDHSFKTFMEIENMGVPGHHSFHYLFENNKLQGVIKTTSLIGLEKKQAKRIAASIYKRVTNQLSEAPNESLVLRKDEGGFSRITLDEWIYEKNPPCRIFHVATNNESSVGVILRDTGFPTSQIFIPATDERFKEQILDTPSITDIPRQELEDIYNAQGGKQQEHPQELGHNSNGKNEELKDFAGEPIVRKKDSYTSLIILAILVFGLIVCVLNKTKNP